MVRIVRPRLCAARVSAIALLLSAVACKLELFPAPKRPERDGYRATFVSADGRRTSIAVRRGKRRAEIGPVVRILDIDARKTILLRTDRKIFFEEPPQPADDIAPGYELDPPFDPKARFPARETQELGDDVQAGHVCALLRLWTSETDSVVYWAAKDLDHLVVRMGWQRLEAGEFKDVRMEELVGVRPGAEESLFRVPAGYLRAASRDAILR
jgi:hypothetical protein